MTKPNNTSTVQEENDSELVSREGTPLHPHTGGRDRYTYMGALEENMVTIPPFTIGSMQEKEEEVAYREINAG